MLYNSWHKSESGVYYKVFKPDILATLRKQEVGFAYTIQYPNKPLKKGVLNLATITAAKTRLTRILRRGTPRK